MYTITWKTFGSDTWHSVLVDSVHTVDRLMDILIIDDEIEQLQLHHPDTSVMQNMEWVLEGKIKWKKT